MHVRTLRADLIAKFAFRKNIIATKPEAQAAKMAQVQDFIGVTWLSLGKMGATWAEFSAPRIT